MTLVGSIFIFVIYIIFYLYMDYYIIQTLLNILRGFSLPQEIGICHQLIHLLKLLLLCLNNPVPPGQLICQPVH